MNFPPKFLDSIVHGDNRGTSSFGHSALIQYLSCATDRAQQKLFPKDVQTSQTLRCITQPLIGALSQASAKLHFYDVGSHQVSRCGNPH